MTYQNKKSMSSYDSWTHFSVEKKVVCYGHIGPLTPDFFQKFLLLFNNLSINTNGLCVRIIYYFNPLNGHYLYPTFFPNTRAKEEKTPLSKGSKKFCPRAIHGDFFSGTLECVLIPKN